MSTSYRNNNIRTGGNETRLVLFFIAAVACVMAFVAITKHISETYNVEPTGHHTYQVQQGDSVWLVASCLNREQSKDVRSIVGWITNNNANGSTLRAGDVITIPYEYGC